MNFGIKEIVTGAIKPLSELIDNLFTSDDERNKAKIALLQTQNEMEVKLLEHDTAIVNAKADVIKAELQQDDLYTKRARPTILYAGIIIMLINSVLLPWIAYFKGVKIPNIELPSEFWLAWGGVSSVFAFGRTKEKLQIKSRQFDN